MGVHYVVRKIGIFGNDRDEMRGCSGLGEGVKEVKG